MQSVNDKKTYILYYDLLNICACFGVVWLHCTGNVFEFNKGGTWIYSLTVQCLVRWSVPIFFMLTGATLMNYTEKYTTLEFFKRRMLRVFVPFLCWSTIYLVYKIEIGEITYEGVRNTISLYLNNGIEGIFWFFYPLFAIYLSMPVLQIFRKEQYKKYVYYMLVIGVIAYGFMPLLSSGLHMTYNEAAIPPVVGGYIIYVLTGWVLSREELSAKTRHFIYGVGMLSAMIMLSVTLIWSVQAAQLVDHLFEYTMFTTYFMSVAVFIWFKYRNWSWLEKWTPFIRSISSASFGIYLVHIALVILVFTNHPERTHVAWMSISAIGIYLISLLGVLVAKKIPVVKWLFP